MSDFGPFDKLRDQDNQPSISRSSAAEYLTFIAANELQEDVGIRNFRITAGDSKKHLLRHLS